MKAHLQPVIPRPKAVGDPRAPSNRSSDRASGSIRSIASPPHCLIASLAFLWALFSSSVSPLLAQQPAPTQQPVFASSVDPADKVDPAQDGWDSEVRSAEAESQLAKVSEWIADGARELQSLRQSLLQSLVHVDYSGDVLVPRDLQESFAEGAIAVRRSGLLRATASGSNSQRDHLGRDGFASALSELTQRLDTYGERRAAFKLFRISEEAEGTQGEAEFTTQAYFEASGRNRESARQINATWSCRWSAASSSTPPLLLSAAIEDYQETETRLEGATLFRDVTAAALGHNQSYRQQLLRGPDHWLSRLTKAQGFTKIGWQGVSVADVNRDGLDDLFLPEQGGLPNKLFVQNQDGTFDDRSSESGVDFLERTLAGLFADLDNDGDADLVLASRPAVLILENDGDGRFTRVRLITGEIPDSHSLSASDYDNDGDLDLYVCAYQRAPNERAIASPVPYHDANNGGRNALLRNDGGFRFSDVTEQTGLDVNNRRFSLAASWEDFDNDGDADLYVANDYGRNNLYRNDGHGPDGPDGSDGTVRFVDVAASAGVEDISSGMSVTWADYDRDGSMDVYVGNMFSAAGNRITYQRRFDSDRQKVGSLEQMQRMARGNSLFRNLGARASPTQRFLDTSADAGVTMGRWSWSSVFADLNNDGWEDLVIANGNLTQTIPDDL